MFLYRRDPILTSAPPPPPVCLSTVDRRSRERFIESNNQIAALVERFRAEGGPYRKHAPPDIEPDTMQLKVPLSAYGRAPLPAVMWSLIW